MPHLVQLVSAIKTRNAASIKSIDGFQFLLSLAKAKLSLNISSRVFCIETDAVFSAV